MEGSTRIFASSPLLAWTSRSQALRLVPISAIHGRLTSAFPFSLSYAWFSFNESAFFQIFVCLPNGRAPRRTRDALPGASAPCEALARLDAFGDMTLSFQGTVSVYNNYLTLPSPSSDFRSKQILTHLTSFLQTCLSLLCKCWRPPLFVYPGKASLSSESFVICRRSSFCSAV